MKFSAVFFNPLSLMEQEYYDRETSSSVQLNDFYFMAYSIRLSVFKRSTVELNSQC